jgi:hypothetical protein
MRTQLETVDYLLNEAAPGSDPHAELTAIRAKIVAGQAISGRDRVFIRDCLTMTDEVECKWMHPTRDGVCREDTKLRKCEHQGQISECPNYERAGVQGRRFGN